MGCWIDRSHDLVEHPARLLLTNPEVLAALEIHLLEVRDSSESLPCFVGSQVVVASRY